MFVIEDGTVYLTRGDDAVLRVTIETEEEEYEMQPGDRLTMTVRALPDANSEIVLKVTSATNELVIPSACTENMSPGRYSMDIRLDLSDGRRATVYPALEGSAHGKVRCWKNFVIDPGVTEVNE